MSANHIRTPIEIDGRPFIRERYVPRTKPEHERNRAQEEARRVRQAERRIAKWRAQWRRYGAALVQLEASGEKESRVKEAVRQLVEVRDAIDRGPYPGDPGKLYPLADRLEAILRAVARGRAA